MSDERKLYEQVGDAMFFLPEYAYSSRTMTDEEIVRNIRTIIAEYKLTHEQWQSLEFAIKAVQSQKCTPDCKVAEAFFKQGLEVDTDAEELTK